jgi:hypothetical protein
MRYSEWGKTLNPCPSHFSRKGFQSISGFWFGNQDTFKTGANQLNDSIKIRVAAHSVVIAHNRSL